MSEAGKLFGVDLVAVEKDVRVPAASLALGLTVKAAFVRAVGVAAVNVGALCPRPECRAVGPHEPHGAGYRCAACDHEWTPEEV